MDPVTAIFNAITAWINLTDKVFTAMPPAEQTAIANDIGTALLQAYNDMQAFIAKNSPTPAKNLSRKS